VDRRSNQSREVCAKVVVICASTLESTRILLNSHLNDHSGMLGKNLMDHAFGAGATGTIEVPYGAFQGPRASRMAYIPRFRNVETPTTGGFIRGYGLQCKLIELRENSHRAGRARIVLSSFAECLASKENSVQIDSAARDAWNIPVLKIKMKFGANELALSRDAAQQAAELLESLGAKEIRYGTSLFEPGLCIHETGTARMGSDSRVSVLDQYCRMHEISNIVVPDGACWVSSGGQNPTLTMMAITFRACDHLIREYRRNGGLDFDTRK
jgi:choline dehydrogenase-like flavoprotein